MEWLDERWVGNRHFKACQKCVAPKRHLGCHATCTDYDDERKAYAKIKESQKRDNELCACIKASNNRIKRHYDKNRKETLSEDYS